MLIELTQDSHPFTITHGWLRAYNAKLCSDTHRPVRLVASDSEHGLLGSLDGSIEWAKLHVDHLVVHPEHRHLGIGTAIMQKAEEFARGDSCTGMYLDTMSFQALGFYTQLGFSQAGEIGGFEGGATKYFLHKTLV